MNGEWNRACAFCDNSFGLFQVVSGFFCHIGVMVAFVAPGCLVFV
jgi:hypothetical protein